MFRNAFQISASKCFPNSACKMFSKRCLQNVLQTVLAKCSPNGACKMFSKQCFETEVATMCSLHMRWGLAYRQTFRRRVLQKLFSWICRLRVCSPVTAEMFMSCTFCGIYSRAQFCRHVYRHAPSSSLISLTLSSPGPRFCPRPSHHPVFAHPLLTSSLVARLVDGASGRESW